MKITHLKTKINKKKKTVKNVAFRGHWGIVAGTSGIREC